MNTPTNIQPAINGTDQRLDLLIAEVRQLSQVFREVAEAIKASALDSRRQPMRAPMPAPKRG